MGAGTMLKNVLTILLILAIIPTIAVFVYTATQNASVQLIPGLTGIINLVPYGIIFGLVLLSIVAIYTKTKTKK